MEIKKPNLDVSDIMILLDVVEEKYRIYEFLCANKESENQSNSDYLLMTTYLELSKKLSDLLKDMEEK